MGLCPRICCLKTRWLSKHHVFPKRWFGNGNGNLATIFLCGECHDMIEKIIPEVVKFTKEQYLELHRHFLKGEDFDTLKELVRSYERKKNHYKNGRVMVLLKTANTVKVNGNGNGNGNGKRKGLPLSKTGCNGNFNQRVLR